MKTSLSILDLQAHLYTENSFIESQICNYDIKFDSYDCMLL